ncbi:MAG: DUF2235 domain-containing protein [Pseudomonadota bacterium]
MRLSNLFHAGRLIRRWFGPGTGPQERAVQDAKTHVVLLDGTLSSLDVGQETSIGLIWKMLRDQGHDCLYYEPGIEWRGWRYVHEVMAGVGINHQIRRAYTFLAHRYTPGDRIILLGYSRGAYAVRALAGLIDRVGLVRADRLSPARVDQAYAHYRDDPTHPDARRFGALHCHPKVEITAVGVFDTVQAVGIRWPILWRLFPHVHAFRSHRLGPSVRHGFHAMALNENRRAFRLDRWRTRGHRTDSVQQVWFPGTHADVGGQVGRRLTARPLANIPLVWMLDQMQQLGLDLPEDWRARFPTDASAPSVGTWRGFGPFFLARKRRVLGMDPSESVHPSVGDDRAYAGLRPWRDTPADGDLTQI